MPTYLWSGKDENGNSRHEKIDADTAQAAKAALLRRGWTDLELVIDDIGFSQALHVECETPGWVRAEGEEEEFQKELERQRAPDRQAAYFKGERPKFIAPWLQSIGKAWSLVLSSTALLALGVFAHRTFPMVFGAVVLVLIFLLHPAVALFFKIFACTAHEYRRLNRAKVWGCWNEVLECVECLRRPDRLTGATVPAFELDRSQAGALAALGRLEEGLAIYKKHENNPKVERWMYLSFLGTIYSNARQFEKALEFRRQAAAENPDSSVVWIDVAYACVRRLNHTSEAREALARAERLEISGLGKPYLVFLRGIILWREHKAEEAIDQLEKALVAFQPLAHNPLVEGLLLSTKAFLCAAYADLRDYAKARKLFREVEPFLVAHQEDELLDACRGRLATV